MRLTHVPNVFLYCYAPTPSNKQQYATEPCAAS